MEKLKEKQATKAKNQNSTLTEKKEESKRTLINPTKLIDTKVKGGKKPKRKRITIVQKAVFIDENQEIIKEAAETEIVVPKIVEGTTATVIEEATQPAKTSIVEENLIPIEKKVRSSKKLREQQALQAAKEIEEQAKLVKQPSKSSSTSKKTKQEHNEPIVMSVGEPLMEEIAQQFTQINVTPNVNFLTTLRNSGYNNYTAIADIIDNSLDTDVNSKNVQVKIKKSKDEYEFISITDDGCGMNIETLNEAFKLGALMGKNKEFDLGSYGTGLKAAALSLGKKFEVRTKAVDDEFYIATYDLTDLINSNVFEIPVTIGSNADYQEFKRNTGNDTGTIITISKLDRLTNANITVFKDLLKSKLGLFYKYFIDELGVKLFVNSELVPSIDPMMRNESYTTCLTSNEKFYYKNIEFKFGVYNIEFVSQSLSNEINRNSGYAGLYVYRNNRLVGNGLDLGLVGKVGDGHLNGLRIELFASGDSDVLFGSTFNKIIHEKDKNEIDQGFRNICRENLKGYIKTVKNNEVSKTANEKISDDVKSEMAEIVKSINKNPFIGIKKERGKNEPKEKEEGEDDSVEIKVEKIDQGDKKERKFTPRMRDTKFADYRFVKFGENGLIFRSVKEHGIYVIEINQEHPFWVKFLNNSAPQTKDVIIKLLFSLGVSLEETEYFDNSEKENLLNEYFVKVSERLRKFIIY